jgi:Ca2+/Na+ antiporter
VVFVVVGLFYLFIGIAIICDELFVPALEVIAENLKLSNDVAGATLMAAGGSAPELATSFVGTFQRSDVGFGTIVGSAVFNVLFVIGMCVMCTPPEFAPLKLTWWPLARDCSYYVLTLITLVLFMNDGVIELWEALFQLGLYFGYVFLMAKSEELEGWFKNKLKQQKVTPVDTTPCAESSDVNLGGKGQESGAPAEDTPEVEKDYGKLDVNASFLRPSTFRAGVLQLLTQKAALADTAGTACVARIKGDVYEVFDKLDKNKNGMIDGEELKQMLVDLGTPETEVNGSPELNR